MAMPSPKWPKNPRQGGRTEEQTPDGRQNHVGHPRGGDGGNVNKDQREQPLSARDSRAFTAHAQAQLGIPTTSGAEDRTGGTLEPGRAGSGEAARVEEVPVLSHPGEPLIGSSRAHGEVGRRGRECQTECKRAAATHVDQKLHRVPTLTTHHHDIVVDSGSPMNRRAISTSVPIPVGRRTRSSNAAGPGVDERGSTVEEVVPLAKYTRADGVEGSGYWAKTRRRRRSFRVGIGKAKSVEEACCEGPAEEEAAYPAFDVLRSAPKRTRTSVKRAREAEEDGRICEGENGEEKSVFRGVEVELNSPCLPSTSSGRALLAADDGPDCLLYVRLPSLVSGELDACGNSGVSSGEGECSQARGRKKSGKMEDGNEWKLFAYAQAVVRPRPRTEESDGRRKGKEKAVDVEVGSECLLARGKGADADAFLKVLNTDLVLESVNSNAEAAPVPGENAASGQCGLEKSGIAAAEQGELQQVRLADQDAPSENVEAWQQCCENRVGKDSQRARAKSGKVSGSGRAAIGVGGTKRTLKTSLLNSKMQNIIELLFRVEVSSNVSVKGTVVKVDRNEAGDTRCVVLLDCYLPQKQLAERTVSFRSASVVSSVFIHLRCDWENRENLLRGLDLQTRGPSYHSGDTAIWNVAKCLVFGCKLHSSLSDVEKNSHFDLHALFKSLPAYDRTEVPVTTRIRPVSTLKDRQSGMWDVPDEVLTLILEKLLPRDLQKAAAVCRHTRALANTVMPCMNLKLYPHQEAAVRWMLHREQNPQTVTHPHIRKMSMPNGVEYHLDCVTGEFLFESPRPVLDFRGGLFCDEPGLGKTVTALSLILKTQGVVSRPPPSVYVQQFIGPNNLKYGYYEIGSCETPEGVSSAKRSSTLKTRRYHIESSDLQMLDSVSSATPARKRSRGSGSEGGSGDHSGGSVQPALRSSLRVKRKLWEKFEEAEGDGFSPMAFKEACVFDEADDRVASGNVSVSSARVKNKGKQAVESAGRKDKGKQVAGTGAQKAKRKQTENDNWAQCDSCGKWRKLLPDDPKPDDALAWFCNMNLDPAHQDCSVPEMFYDRNERIMRMPGFTGSGHDLEEEQNIVFFRNVLKEKRELFDAETRRAVFWLANLSADKLARATVGGLSMPPGLRLASVSGQDEHRYDEVFEAFGLVKRKEQRKGIKWVYPRGVVDLAFDAKALKVALSRPVDDCTRFFLSKATLIVVPQNLIEHWKTQIRKHTKPGQLKIFVWNDVRKPPAPHSLAWDYDIVITTFTRLSIEWTSRSSSPLLLIHWLRIMLDEGHTLGSSLTWTNKFQMAICMQASRRWLLTGTPTPNTPSSQVSHLQPMLKFLHEPFYGHHHKLWDGGILRPFEGRREEGLQRLTKLLQRCMISARKSDLNTIPPCIRKNTLLNFTEQHAMTYNELVVTVKRNILMADWNDPSHVESLLNPKLWKLRSNTLRNVRLSCCVAGHIKVWNAGEDIRETMGMFADQGMDPKSELYIIIKAALVYGGDCQRCQEWCRLPIITPCRHLLCISCVALDREMCALPGCGNRYQMQSPEDRARPENPNPKWPVPQDLIELQPSYVQDNWDPDWHATSSSKVAYLVEQVKAIQERNEQLKIKLNDRRKKLRVEKVIVFSQFLEHIHVVEAQLFTAGLRFVGMYSPMHMSNKMKALAQFQNIPDFTVIVMDGSAALGLDLSFVTHVYLMEPIWDRSVEEQVVSRAHRMGATRPVLVETLAMRGTIEEQMIDYLQNPVVFTGCEKHVQDTYERGSKAAHRSMHDPAESNYLSRLEFVSTKNGIK